MDLIIGSHVSFNKDTQMIGSIKEALSYEANTFMFYTGAPQNTKRVSLDNKLIIEAQKLMKENNIDINNVIVHAPYIINLANSKNKDFNEDFLKQEIDRVESLGVTKLVIHPGSHVGLGEEAGLKNIIDSLNNVIKKDSPVIVCLETMAGKGSELGKSFEELKTIIDNIKYKDRIGVCLDTCHINDAGYDITNFDKVLSEFDSIIGLDKLMVIHLNDSKNEINTHKDRHANIGYGTLGFNNIINIVYNSKIKGVPIILETPYVGLDSKYPPYRFEIKMLKEKKFIDNLEEEIINYYNKC